MALDDEYYKELGMTPEEAAEQLEDLWNVDPEAYFLDEGAAQRTPDEAAAEQAAPYGPPAIVLAGFRDHEPAMARATLDMLGGQAVKVLPAVGPLLWGTVAEALAAPEPDWEQPRPEAGPRSGDWGSQRTLLFSGLSQEDALAILDVFEEGGLPQLMVAVATQENAHRVLGEVLAEAIQEQRRRKLRSVEYPPMQAQQPAEAGQAGPARLHWPQPSGAGSRADAERVSVREVASAQQPQQQAQASRGPQQQQRQPQQPQAGQEQQQRQQPSQPQSEARQEQQQQPDLQIPPQASQQQEVQPTQQRWRQASGSTPVSAPAASAASASAASSAAAATPGSRQQRPAAAAAGPAAAAAAAEGASGSSRQQRQQQGQGQVSSAEVRESFQASMKEGSAAFLANFEHNTFASEQRELRAAAAQEMAARAERSRAAGAAAQQLRTENLIDAAAAGEDTDALLRPLSGSAAEASASQEASKQAARSRMEQVLQQMRESADQLRPEQQQQLAADLKVLEREQETVEKVLTDMGASLENVPQGDREILKAKLREEALQPTRDAIGAALACGVSAAELRAMVAEAEADAREHRLGWYPSLAQLERRGGQPSQGA